MNKELGSIWKIPFFLVIFLILVLSLRQLSDPDIGSHLRAGKWIIENKSVPGKDTFTYTVNSHDYIDMNWLFQVLVYSVYQVSGYRGLSLFVLALILCLIAMFLFRMRKEKIPLSILTFVLLIAFLVLEVRITLRPELFTFLFLTLSLIVLEDYYFKRNNRLWTLPVIMLLWCNMHGLFILGFGLMGTCFISLLIHDRKIDRQFFLWMMITIAISFVNPYFYKGVIFPFELFTRFDTSNVFHEHIRELQSFYQLDNLYLKDVIFLAFLSLTLFSILLTFRKRTFHQFLLFFVFSALAIASIRNIALFAVISVPLLSVSLRDVNDSYLKKTAGKYTSMKHKVPGIILWVLMIIVPVMLIMRILTGSYYHDNKEYSKTGLGIDQRQLPEKAAAFLIRENLTGRILNGISLGGWLSWRIPQPVFIDGRLEVIGEELYQELTESWVNGLPELADKYQAGLIVYNYQKYYPWTVQLEKNQNWMLQYIDGVTVIFRRKTQEETTRPLNTDSVCLVNGVPVYNEAAVISLLQRKPVGRFREFLEGFYRPIDLAGAEHLNIGSFFLQTGYPAVAERFLLSSLDISSGKNRHVLFALSDIYRIRGDLDKTMICYRRILESDPGNQVVKASLYQVELMKQNSASGISAEGTTDYEARKLFSEANILFQQGDATKALSLYDEAIRLSPGYYKAYNNRAILKASLLKNYKEAINDFTRAIEIKPDYSDAYLGRGSSKLELRDLQGACSDWKKAADLGNKKAVTLILRYCSSH